jgi:ferrous iron transport protein A
MVINQSGLISRVKGGGELGVRIREMGLVPGAEIKIVGRAPLNDPVRIKLYGSDLTLRNNEADRILVEVADAAEAGAGQ